jgi:hypothetical protein
MQAAIMVEWMESEAGWGQRPDGYSLHLSKDDAEKYIRDYWAGMPPRDEHGRPPEVYERPGSNRTLVMIDNNLHAEIEASPKPGVRVWENQMDEYRKKKRVVMGHDM